MNDTIRRIRLLAHSDVHDYAPARAEAEAAFRDILCRIGENPDRDGLQEFLSMVHCRIEF
jgi:GTP cyclohydrolase I